MLSADGRPTLATVAALTGVSKSTVSKVLNHRADVAPGTRALVKSVLQQHNYVERRSKPSPQSGVADQPTIQLLFLGPIKAYATEILRGVLDAGSAAGVAVVVDHRSRGQGRAAERPAAWANDLVAAGHRALIAVVDELTAGDVTALSRAHLPLVLIDPLNLPNARLTSVGSTNFTGGLAATHHLLSLGHRRIGYVGGYATAACNQARLHGYRAAMEAEGAPILEGYVRSGRFRYRDGVVHGAALLDLADPPTAVFAASDEMAVGVIEAARARGLRIPENLSVVGFDDTYVAQLASPPLTTVRQPLQEMGGVALRTALQLADGETLDSHHVELGTELVIRGSTAPATAKA